MAGTGSTVTGPTVIGHIDKRGARDVDWLTATQPQCSLIVAPHRVRSHVGWWEP